MIGHGLWRGIVDTYVVYIYTTKRDFDNTWVSHACYEARGLHPERQLTLCRSGTSKHNNREPFGQTTITIHRAYELQQN